MGATVPRSAKPDSRMAPGAVRDAASHPALCFPSPAHSDPQEPEQSQTTAPDPANPSSGDDLAASISNSHEQPSPAPATQELTPGRDSQAELKEPSPTDSLPWPEAPEECPPRPNTLDFSKSLKRLEEVKQTGQRRNSEQVAKENGVELSPAAVAPAASQERRALEAELGRCIEDFRRIRIPTAFPNKKRQWQSELLRKYQL